MRFLSLCRLTKIIVQILTPSQLQYDKTYTNLRILYLSVLGPIVSLASSCIHSSERMPIIGYSC